MQCALTSKSDLSACYAQAGAEIAENSHLWIDIIGFQILNFTRPEGGIRVSRTFSTSSRVPTDNAVKFNIWKSITMEAKCIYARLIPQFFERLPDD